MSTSNQYGPSNMPFSPNFMMNSSFTPRAHSPFGYGFSFQDLLHSPNIPFENPVTNTSTGLDKSNKATQNTRISNTVGGSKNWSKDEDVALTKAWLYISVDAYVGNNKKLLKCGIVYNKFGGRRWELMMSRALQIAHNVVGIRS
ncbi:unnamed protein product [Cuscuta europaea]|uniref:Uncharacterized protein n=1 Tax=Cuscuta europaea TaxID=41803 RepID=A0A9P1E1M0_CUSEU|nr:unnamed protein product [Cuscuta europaea]